MKDLVKDEVEVKAEPVLSAIEINLAPGAGMAINYSGRQYIHGAKYKVDNGIAQAVMEIQNRGWAHEASLKESENKGRSQKRAFI